jgi:hypothetical protein
MERGSATRKLGCLLATGALACVMSGEAAVRGEAAPTSAPLADTGGTSNVTSTSAVVHGRVNPHGTATSFSFQYGTTRQYGGQTPLASAGGGTTSVPVSQAVVGLRPGTTYHYRLVAVGAGTTTGGDHTFKTAKIPLSLTVRPTRNPVVYGNALVLAGTLSGSNSAGRRLLLKVNPFPYVRGFATLGASAFTDATGAFSFFVPALLQNSELRVTAAGKPSVSSPVLAERVAVRVSLHVRRAARRGYVRLYGTVAPAEVGAGVAFQRLGGSHRWVTESGTVVKRATSRSSRFSRTVRLRHRGLYRAFVRISDPAHVSYHSGSVQIR